MVVVLILGACAWLTLLLLVLGLCAAAKQGDSGRVDTFDVGPGSNSPTRDQSPGLAGGAERPPITLAVSGCP